MHYIFVINGRKDKQEDRIRIENALKELKDSPEVMAADPDFSWETYITLGAGDATRFVNIHCDLHPRDEVCFVACGGAGTANEVASGLVRQANKYLAIFHCNGTNDLTKSFPDYDFTDLKKIIGGRITPIDVIKVNDNYAINVFCTGFDAVSATLGNHYIMENKSNPYVRGIINAMLFYRRTKFRVTVDGEQIKWRHFLQAVFANGRYYGGDILCAPYASPTDGLIEFVAIKPLFLIPFAIVWSKYAKGQHLTSNYCKRRLVYRRAKHIEISAKDLLFLNLDGETIHSSHVTVDIQEKALNLVLPRQDKPTNA